MKEITIKLYTYEELTPAAKNAAIKNFKNINVQAKNWYEDAAEKFFKEVFEKSGVLLSIRDIEGKDIRDGNSSFGIWHQFTPNELNSLAEAMHFTIDGESPSDFLKTLTEVTVRPMGWRWGVSFPIDYLTIEYESKRAKGDSHYCGEVLNDFFDAILYWTKNVIHNLHEVLREEYKRRTSEKEIEKALKEKNYFFLSTGKRYRK